LLIGFGVGSVTSAATAQFTSSVGLTFSQFAKATYNGSANSLYGFVSDGFVTNAASQTVDFGVSGDETTGTIIFVCAVAGMPTSGLAAVRQFAVQNNGAAAGTPAPAFASLCLTGNVTLGCVGNNAAAAGSLTPPTGWTEPASTGDLAYATPSTGGEYCFRDSGFTGTTVTWGSASATVFGAIIVELAVTQFPVIAALMAPRIAPERPF